MLKWITDFIKKVERSPQNYNENIKNNVRQIKELLTRKNIFYKEADPISCYKFAKLHKHREGEWAGQPIVFDEIQKYTIACVLGIKTYDKERKMWLRYFTELNFFVSRKYGKDHFMCPIVEWLVALDKEPSAWIQILAENEKQSKRTYDIIRKSVEQPPLNALFDVKKTEKYIHSKLNDGKIEYLSGRSTGKDGSNAYGLLNEIHEITKLNQYNAIKTGQGARRQPMMVCISSAGVTPDSLYESLYERNKKFLSKTKLGKNDRIFALMFGIDDTDDYKDESCWIKANPMMPQGRPSLRFLREQYEAMKGDPILLNSFIAKHLNRQIGASIDYFDMISIKNSMREIKQEEFVNGWAVGGVDLAETTDLCNATAQILCKDGKFRYLQAYFIAEDVLERNSKKDKQDYQSMTNLAAENEITSELVIVTPGSYVRSEYVTQWFTRLRDKYGVTFLKIGYDRALAKEWLTDMKENGYPHEKTVREDDLMKRDFGVMTEVAQGGWTLSEPIKIVKSLFENGSLVFDSANKLMPYCFYNLKVRQDTNNNLSPHKAKSTGHIDGAIGVFNAFVAYQRAKELYSGLYGHDAAELFKI